MPKQNPVVVMQEEQEMKQVRRDLARVIVLNGIFFAILIGLYVWNLKSSGLDNFFEKLLNF